MFPKIFIPYLLLLYMNVKVNIGYLITSINDWVNIYKHQKLPPKTAKTSKIQKRTARAKLMRTLMLLSTVTTVIRGSELQLSNQLNAFVNANGLLQTRKLPRSLINDVRGLLKENLIEELLNNNELNTGILDT